MIYLKFRVRDFFIKDQSFSNKMLEPSRTPCVLNKMLDLPFILSLCIESHQNRCQSLVQEATALPPILYLLEKTKSKPCQHPGTQNPSPMEFKQSQKIERAVVRAGRPYSIVNFQTTGNIILFNLKLVYNRFIYYYDYNRYIL